jgi:hypothetical protein
MNYASRAGLAARADDTQQIFKDINYALSGPKGMDSLIGLCTHSFIIATPEHDKIFIDCTNAFNNISREVAGKAILENCPDLYSLLDLLYGKASFVWLKDEVKDWERLLIEMGCVQGCVLGPYVFGFASLELYKGIQATLKGKENAFFSAFSDDSFVSALHSDSLVAFKAYLQQGPLSGLHVNFKPGKTIALLGRCEPAEVESRVQAYRELGFPLGNIRVHPDNGGPAESYGYIHLGVPQGSVKYQEEELRNIIKNFTKSCGYGDIIDEAQYKWVYLNNIIKNKVSFWLRSKGTVLYNNFDFQTHYTEVDYPNIRRTPVSKKRQYEFEESIEQGERRQPQQDIDEDYPTNSNCGIEDFINQSILTQVNENSSQEQLTQERTASDSPEEQDGTTSKKSSRQAAAGRLDYKSLSSIGKSGVRGEEGNLESLGLGSSSKGRTQAIRMLSRTRSSTNDADSNTLTIYCASYCKTIEKNIRQSRKSTLCGFGVQGIKGGSLEAAKHAEGDQVFMLQGTVAGRHGKNF